MTGKKTSYREAGVDIDKATAFIDKIKPLIKTTARKGAVGEIGGFGGLFHLGTNKYKNPLARFNDGWSRHETQDSPHDGQAPYCRHRPCCNERERFNRPGRRAPFLLDYIATGKLKLETTVKIVEGIAKGCTEAGCALIGGETAEMPGFYKDDEYDLAGFCVGVVEYDNLIDGSEIRVGDTIIGLVSNGVHSNGYSLARKVLFAQGGLDISDKVEGIKDSIGMELLRPTKIYVKPVLNLIKNFSIKGIAHITGGGLTENIPRILPRRCRAVIVRKTWTPPPIFKNYPGHGWR